MIFRMLTGAACAALMLSAMPASAAGTPELPPFGMGQAATAGDPGVSAFYAARRGAPVWLQQGPDSPAARQLIDVLQRAQLDGLHSGPALAHQAQSLLNRARAGDGAALANAERLLSTAWVLYVQGLSRAPAGMIYSDGSLAPRAKSASQILSQAASAPSLAQHVRTVSEVNPIYSQLRAAAWQQLQMTGGAPDSRLLANLERARALPGKGRSIVVDAGTAQLFMIEDGRIVDSMRVIVGKPSTQTPMIASTIHYATLNPYWNVPADLVQRLIAPRVLEKGLSYLSSQNYEVLAGSGDYEGDAEVIPADSIDWKAVAAGEATVRVRQRPGPANSMGQLKFGFANSNGIYLHDSPLKQLFAQDDRAISNGCIRLEDAERLGRWMLGRDPSAIGSTPEQHVLLPRPVPVYVTYLTVRADGGQLAFVEDVYGRDARRASELASR